MTSLETSTEIGRSPNNLPNYYSHPLFNGSPTRHHPHCNDEKHDRSIACILNNPPQPCRQKEKKTFIENNNLEPYMKILTYTKKKYKLTLPYLSEQQVLAILKFLGPEYPQKIAPLFN
jgi:hypothetical protein